MPKANRVGKSRAQAKAAALPTSAKDHDITIELVAEAETGKSLSKGQQKRQARRDEFLRKLETVNSSLSLDSNKKMKNPSSIGLDKSFVCTEMFNTNAEGTTTTTSPPKPKPKPKSTTSNKKKKQVAIHELEQLKLVLQHPSFVENPFATIQSHLENTLAAKTVHKLTTGPKKITPTSKAKPDRKKKSIPISKNEKKKKFGSNKMNDKHRR
ncbi:hypothetical protein ScalyP_jg6879 [Parmales sp. scaly parma]|nr:hypothetical protein ScalyP_jg6879 [Parmales sp. scaly parma]